MGDRRALVRKSVIWCGLAGLLSVPAVAGVPSAPAAPGADRVGRGHLPGDDFGNAVALSGSTAVVVGVGGLGHMAVQILDTIPDHEAQLINVTRAELVRALVGGARTETKRNASDTGAGG